jgi:GNAT superfamily N-acetyltransferase
MAEVRRVRREEWRALRDIRLRALEDAPAAFATRFKEARERPDEWWIEWASKSAQGEGQAMFLAWDGAAPLGIVGTFLEADRRWLISMWTDPETRRRGVGRALVEATVAFARAAGSRDLFLQVLEENATAHSLYRSCGFEDDGPGEPHVDRPTRRMRLAL